MRIKRALIAGGAALVLLAVLLLLPLPGGDAGWAANTTVTAHTGAFDTEDNSLWNFQAVLACPGIDIVEADLRFFDGAPMFAHGRKLPSAPVTPEHLFIMVAGTGRGVNLDLKNTRGDMEGLSRLAEKYGLEGSVFLTGVYPYFLPVARRSGLPYYYEATPFYSFSPLVNRAVCAFAKRAGAMGLNISYKFCTEKLVNTAHRAGLRISVWTVDDEDAMRRVLALGVDNITSRYPDTVRSLLEEKP